MFIALSLSLQLMASPVADPAPVSLSLTGIGRFAIMADRASIRRNGDMAQMRSLQISEEDMVIGDKAYVGGWSNWQFDCKARMADRLDFSSLLADLTTGPSTPENNPPYEISPGGDAAELADVACGVTTPDQDAASVAEAVRLARQKMKD